MADHRAVGLATLDAARDAGNRWIFPELLEEGYEPWNGVRSVLTGGAAGATHAVDVTAFIDKGIESLQKHRVYIDNLGVDFDPDTFSVLQRRRHRRALRLRLCSRVRGLPDIAQLLARSWKACRATCACCGYFPPPSLPRCACRQSPPIDPGRQSERLAAHGLTSSLNQRCANAIVNIHRCHQPADAARRGREDDASVRARRPPA